MRIANDGIGASQVGCLLVVAIDGIEQGYLLTIRIFDGNGIFGNVGINGVLEGGPVHDGNLARCDGHGIAAGLRIILANDEGQLTLEVRLVLLAVAGLHQSADKVATVHGAHVDATLADGCTIDSTSISTTCSEGGYRLIGSLAKNPLLAAKAEAEAVACSIGKLGVQRLDALTQLGGRLYAAVIEGAEGDVVELALQVFD